MATFPVGEFCVGIVARVEIHERDGEREREGAHNHGLSDWTRREEARQQDSIPVHLLLW